MWNWVWGWFTASSFVRIVLDADVEMMLGSDDDVEMMLGSDDDVEI